MAVIFQTVLMRLALCGLAASLVLFALQSRIARDAFARMLSIWRSLTVFGRVAVCSFFLIGILIGGDKANSVPPNMNSPLPQMQHGGVFLTGFTGLTGLSGALLHTPFSLNPVNLVNPVQNSFAERKAANWNIRGAWKDSFWLPFDDGWVFPWGTNHLSGVEVVSCGQIWPTPFDTNAVVSAGLPFEIVRGLTTFAYELTPSNSYRFVWTDAAINRDTNNLVTAALELFRNGDVSVTTNGVAAHLPRVLPFPHNGFGQDAEWVTANFTNATEILAVGYPQWVDQQVGVGLTNGLYKLSVAVADDPPETTFLSVGDFSVAITNAGEYVFLLSKCIDYPLSVFPEVATDFVYSAADDIEPRPTMLGMAGINDGRWTTDRRGLQLVSPMYPLTLFTPRSHVLWIPTLQVSPSTWQPSAMSDTETFAAIVGDIPQGVVNPLYRWNTSDPDVVSISTPILPATQMTCHCPAADLTQASLSLEVTIGDCTLHSFYVLGPDGGGDGICLTISAPDVLFVNDDDDDANGNVDCVMPFSGDDDIIEGRILFHSPAVTNGTVVLEGVYGYDEGFGGLPLVYSDASCTEPVEPGSVYPVLSCTDWSMPLYFNPATISASHPGVHIRARWVPETGAELTASKRLTIVSPVAEPVCSTMTNVVEDGVEHCYVVNPCGVAVGREAYFSVEVSPTALPDSEIVWVKSQGLDFVGPSTGRRVTVRGTAAGYESLAVHVGGRADYAPTFQVRVVEPVTVNLRAWIISDIGNNKAREVDQVRQMVKDANDIYAQVGVTLNLVEPVVVTNIPDAYDALCETPTNATSKWTFDEIVNVATNTYGLECYFINSFVDSRHTKAAHGCGGIVVTSLATRYTLAHEIGHAFGLCDIYKSNEGGKAEEGPLVALGTGEMASFSNLYDDWNGGCSGQGAPGTRYYQGGTKMKDIIDRILMLGEVPEYDSRRDITNGGIYGVHYHYDVQGNKVWEKGLAPLAFPWGDRSPVHN